MSSLAIVGPQVLPNPGYGFEPDEIVFQNPGTDPVVSGMYRTAYRSAKRLRLDVSFPIAQPEFDPRRQWLDAVHRLASADAILAVFTGESRAIPTEASLAVFMSIPLLLVAVDTYFIEPFEQSGIPIISGRSQAFEVEDAIRRLFGESAGGAGQPTGVPVW